MNDQLDASVASVPTTSLQSPIPPSTAPATPPDASGASVQTAPPQQPTPPPTPQTQPQPPATPSPSAQSSAPKFKIDFTLDDRTKLTVQWSAIWFAVAEAIKIIGTYFSNYFIGGIAGEFMRAFGGLFSHFPAGMLVKEVIWGIITGAIAGFILSKFYPFIQDWNRRYLKGKLNTMFKLLFYPALAGSILGFFLGSALSFAIGMGPILITTISIIVAEFLYAKMLSGKIGGLYEPPA